jgi:hypothetical protein
LRSFDQAKFALTLLQNWPCQNEVIKLGNKKNSKITTSRVPHLKPIPTNVIQKGLIFCLQSNLEGILKEF